MSNVTLNLGLAATGRNQQASATEDDPGNSVADRVAAIMKKIGKLQKEAAALQGPPEEVAKMRKAIEAEIRALELKMEQMMEQQARDQQEAQSATKSSANSPGDQDGEAGAQDKDTPRKRRGHFIDEVV
ncbi:MULTISPECIES: FlxA-like family protein [Herbaspirillum]|uniref:FlxA-like family protein n=1 Tax=Herbaspirillum huttiense subsp. lycopersici TaxID=3074428 RepID=A0ABU2EMM7_9BURK|nr:MULTISPECIES: FlxA-like family protein [Herbaspirillum]MBP1317373.1 biopolymer transport protein ExbB/TolQ [Herbaspirillum sp. 1130]MDR6741399.1 biopolymer transport protein ExbB/TolQ [Herbaspirillum sp. 1173]MDR9849108.1 FlxA-like family protein [Herbaspirillum huttiense SE1]